jgi:hypothetical protein
MTVGAQCIYDVKYMNNWLGKLKQQHILFLCFIDRASRYDRVKKNQIDAQLILSTFRQPLRVSGHI